MIAAGSPLTLIAGGPSPWPPSACFSLIMPPAAHRRTSAGTLQVLRPMATGRRMMPRRKLVSRGALLSMKQSGSGKGDDPEDDGLDPDPRGRETRGLDVRSALFLALGAVATIGPRLLAPMEAPGWWEGGGEGLGDFGMALSCASGVACAGWLLPILSKVGDAEMERGGLLYNDDEEKEEAKAGRQGGDKGRPYQSVAGKEGDGDVGAMIKAKSGRGGGVHGGGGGGIGSDKNCETRLAVLFRGRSRCTFGFDSARGFFDLPIAEWQAACEAEGVQGSRLVRMAGGCSEAEEGCLEVEGTAAAWWIQPPHEEGEGIGGADGASASGGGGVGGGGGGGAEWRDSIMRVAARCILVHGLYDVAAYGMSYPEAVEEGQGRGGLPGGWKGKSWRVRVVGVGRKQDLTRGEVEERVSALEGLLGDLDQGDRDESSPKVSLCSVEDGSTVFLGRMLVRGLAVGKKDEYCSTPRWPRQGILRDYALKSRKVRSKTAMEPEIAFLMANLARVAGPKHRILDPFCGSCSMLLSAAAFGGGGPGEEEKGNGVGGERGVECIGSDLDPSVAANGAAIAEMFKEKGFAPPRIITSPVGGVQLRSLAPLGSIVTDPPYDMGAQAVARGGRAGDEGESSSSSERGLWGGGGLGEGVESLILELFGLAGATLGRGSRLVFFLPVRGQAASQTLDGLSASTTTLPAIGHDFGASSYSDSVPCSLPELPASQGKEGDAFEYGGMRLEFARRQAFTPTFCRWLLVMRKL